MTIQENASLAPYTTFKIGGPGRFFCRISNETELVEAVKFAHEKKLSIFVIGGGSNILVNDRGFDGLVIKMEIKGIEKVIQDSGFRIQDENKRDEVDNNKKVIISVGAGEIWDDFVAYAVEQGLYGVENLSSIPGTVGASPVQNIGAYGMEVSQTIHNVRAFDTESMSFVELSNAECLFSYRESLFKKNKGRYIVTRVDFVLDPKGKVNFEYRDVQNYFADRKVVDPKLSQVREAVISIRAGKLPDWKVWGTAGSFFKNPIISADQFAELSKKYPGIPGFPESDGWVKVSLGWILDKVCNVRGRRVGKAQVYEKQALVLVAESGATSEEVFALAKELMNCVKEKTGITIEGEVEWVN